MGGDKEKKIKTKKIKVKAYRNVDGRFFFAIIKRHGDKKEMVSLIRDENTSGRAALSANTVDLQQDLMMISDLTTTESTYQELVEGLPDNYTVENDGGTIRFVEDSDPVNDPVEEIATVEDCEEQKVNSSMAAIGIGSQYFDTWMEAMQLCGNDICSPQCVEAVAAVPYMFGTRTDLDLNTTTNLMIFYLGSTAGLSAEQATWLRGSTLTLTSVYQYLLSRDTELDCGYKSETGIAGRIAGAFIDERVELMIPTTIDDFACTIEDYFYCVRDDYSRAELAFNAAMDVYEQYGSTCSMCAGTLSARGSVCPCEEDCLASSELIILLNLTNEEEDALCSADIQLLNMLEFLLIPNNIVFCSSQSSLSQIIKEMIATNTALNIMNFNAELDKEEFIQLGASFANNSKAKCVWDRMSGSTNNLISSTLDNFTGSSDIDLNLYVQDIPGNVNGSTQVLTNTNNLAFSISLSEEFVEIACPIEITKTILHEAIHAEIKRRFRVFTSDQLSQLYPTMLAYISNEFDDHHEYMANEWFATLLNATKEFYPTGYTQSEYSSITWSGLQGTDAFTTQSGLTLNELINNISQLREKCDTSCE